MPFILKESLIKDRAWIDFSSLQNFMQCPRWYYWRSRRNLSTGPSAALIAGKAVHEAIAKYHECKMADLDEATSRRTALDELPPIMAELTDDDPKRNMSVLIERLINYFNYWERSTDVTMEVEVGFAVDLAQGYICIKCAWEGGAAPSGKICPTCGGQVEPDGPIYVGKIDRVVRTEFGILINETKTTTIVGNRWHLRTKPNMQIDGYVNAYTKLSDTKVAGGRLDGIPLHDKPTSKHDPFRFITMRSPEELEAWEANARMWYKLLRTCRTADNWPMNTERCFPLTGYSCPYPTLCEMYPAVPKGDIEIPSEFQVDVWVPWDGLE